MLFDLTDNLKSAVKKCQEKKKKSAQDYFVFNYVIERCKLSKFYHLRVLIQLNFLQKYESSKF